MQKPHAHSWLTGHATFPIYLVHSGSWLCNPYQKYDVHVAPKEQLQLTQRDVPNEGTEPCARSRLMTMPLAKTHGPTCCVHGKTIQDARNP